MTIILPFILFLFSGFTSILINNKRILSIIFILSALFALGTSSFFLRNINVEVSYVFGGFLNEVGIEYTGNALKFTILTLFSALIFIFSIFFYGFVRTFNKEFSFNLLFCVLQIMCASLFAIVLTNDLFNFYIFFELLAICIYILIALGGKGSTYASFNYLVLGIIASGFLVIGIGFLYFSTGYLNISKVSSLIKQQNISVLIAFFFILVGFLVKLAVFPFSFWPSLVYKYFPAGILPFYAGVISIITFYGFFLFLTKFFLKEAFDVTNFVLILCGIGVILFSFFSLFESNVKKILAYSTISQVSYAFFPLFITDAKLTAIVFLHIFLNGISKFALFVILFEILKEKQNSTINSLDGFASKSGFLSFFLLLFFANIVGLPILPMFFTKIYLILELLNIKQYIFILVILVGAVLNFIYFWRISSAIFFKKIHEEYSKPCKIMPESKISVILIFTILVLILIFFNSIINFLTISLEQFYYNV